MIVEYNNFLTPQECDTLISLGESGNLRAGRIHGSKLGYRKAKVRWFNDHPLVEKIKDEVSKLSNLPLENQEDFHFVKYEPNGEYKPHYDGRCKTALIYLNNTYKGGQTNFPNINRVIKPEVGKLIIWDNIDEFGKNDPESFHEGLPVEFGNKYIAVIWIDKHAKKTN
jgi:prolyl 4-hydroxylase